MVKQGFILCQGRKLYFLESDKKTKCRSVIDDFIKGLCSYRGFDDEYCQRCLESEPLREDIAYRTNKGQYELVTTENGFQYHHFEEKYSIMNFPLDDCEEVVFIK